MGFKGLALNYTSGFQSPDLAFLEQVPFVEDLHILSYWWDDISPIHHLHELRNLEVCTRPERTPIDFTRFPHLESLFLEWRPKSDSIFQCKTLREVYIMHYAGKSTEPFGELPKLEDLKFSGGSISRLEALGRLTRLRKLGLYYLRRLTTLDGVQDCPWLRDLDIEACKKITTIDPTSAVTALTKFGLKNCGEIDSIKPLANLTNLANVEMWESTNVLDGDLTPLLNLPRLKAVRIANRRHYNMPRGALPGND